jgi:hypothetical protein
MGPKRNDLEPALYADVADGSGVADLTTVSSWRMIARMRDVVTPAFIDTGGNMVITVNPSDHTKAVIKHTWQTGETATAGVLLIEYEATWPGGRKQTFPNNGYIAVRILEDLV